MSLQQELNSLRDCSGIQEWKLEEAAGFLQPGPELWPCGTSATFCQSQPPWSPQIPGEGTYFRSKSCVPSAMPTERVTGNTQKGLEEMLDVASR